MSAGTLCALASGFLVAFLNGANDVSKGIATLAGSGVTDYRRAILWGTLWTGGGALASSVFSKPMVATFGTGLLARQSVPTLTEGLAVLLGTALCVGLATHTSLPVSTTHAIIGSLAGVYCFAHGVGGINWPSLGEKIALPLAVSPILALGMTLAILRIWRLAGERLGKSPECLCLDLEVTGVPAGNMEVAGNALAFSPAMNARAVIGSEQTCAAERPAALRVTCRELHWLTSGATSFARGLNDAPKIAALILVVLAVSTANPALKPWTFVVVALGVAAGSYVAGEKVTALLAERITPMDHQEGFVANLTTAALVAPGAALGLPMSTTHVSSGAIIGLGVQKTARINWRTVQHMVLAWIITVPLAACAGCGVYVCLSLLRRVGIGG